MSSSNNGTVLHLTDLSLDKIAITGNVLGEDAWEGLSDERIIKTILGCEQLLARFILSRQTDEACDVDDSWLGAFWRTLLGDLIMEEFPKRRAEEADRDSVLELLRYHTKTEIYTSLHDMVVNQAFFITKNGYIGIRPPTTMAGDEVWVLFGGKVPFVLRRRGVPQGLDAGEANEHLFMGDVYVHTIMDGEATTDCEQKVKAIRIY